MKRKAKRRTADIAYDAIEAMISTLQLAPGTLVVEGEIAESTGLGRTPVREALLRMISIGLIDQQPRRGLLVSNINLADYLDLLQTRRALEALLACAATRRATSAQRREILRCAETMVAAAAHEHLDDYMKADQELDNVVHAASQNRSAVKAVVPLVVQCRRFWYAYQHEGDIQEGARAHMALAHAIAGGDEAAAVVAANRLLDYLEQFARRVIDR
ncbi:MAG: GntR family transcriptional regulator [Paucibacter sp.]|nr:GntR family transcriptional regulator [Roseateles sp.]